MSDGKDTTPSVVTDPADFNEVLEKLNEIDEKIIILHEIDSRGVEIVNKGLPAGF